MVFLMPSTCGFQLLVTKTSPRTRRHFRTPLYIRRPRGIRRLLYTELLLPFPCFCSPLACTVSYAKAIEADKSKVASPRELALLWKPEIKGKAWVAG